MFRHIIWDVDGTLFDTYPTMARAIRAALNDLGKDAPLDWIQKLAKESLGHCGSVLADTYGLQGDDLWQQFDKHYACITPEENLPFPGVIDVCEYIRSLKGKNVVVTHRGRQGTTELLAAHHMAHYFAGCVSGDDGYPRKPHPGAFEAAMAHYDLKRKETLTVGDRAIDILAGQAAGIFSCFYGPEPEAVDADLVVSSFDDLHQYLLVQNGECPFS
jgi:HAD superfamily hydrolase (TIGR01509 family)